MRENLVFKTAEPPPPSHNNLLHEGKRGHNHRYPATYDKDLKHFIKSHTTQLHEVMLSINTNEDFDPGGGEIATLVSKCHLIDPIAQLHGYTIEPETYIRGTDRIYFIFCTLTIAAFVTTYSITTYDEIAPSDHRG